MNGLTIVPSTKCRVKNDLRQTRWKSQVFCLSLTLAVVASVYALKTWFDFATFHDSTEDSSVIFSSEFIPTRNSCNDCHRDINIAAWSRRAKMYSESTRHNQNAEWNATIPYHELLDLKANRQIVVCYYTIPRDVNSSQELEPSQLDPQMCTHIIVGFASVVNCSINLGNASEIYERVARLKKRASGLRVMISAGGFNENQGGFSEMVKLHANRKQFIRSVLNVTKVLNLDGLDVDWEFPNWLDGASRERIYFVQLLQELRKEFDRSGRQLLLSIAVAAPAAIVDQSYNIPEIAEHVDFVCLMSYDYHFYVWYFPLTGYNAPLYRRSDETGYTATMNVNYSAMYWLSKGMPREKLVIGIPTYGHTYELDNPFNHDFSAPAKGYGKLALNGFISYMSVCLFLKAGAIQRFDEESQVPYAYKHDDWVSFEDTISVRQKAEWIKAKGFGGAMVFSLNADDWNSSCLGVESNKLFPLTRVISDVIQGSDSFRIT